MSRMNSGVPSRTTQMTLKEQERVVDEIKKENFGLKMKVYFLEERLSKLGPDEMERALKENVDIKIQNHDLKIELKEYKKLLLESDKAIQTLQQNGTGCLLQHGMSPAEEVAYHRAINRAEELSQENDRIQRKLAEQQGENKRLHELIKITRPEINFDDEAPLDLLDSSTENQQLKGLINRDNRLSGDQSTKIAMLKETLRKEKDEKHSISLEAERLRQQILDLKSQMAESNVELKKFQETAMKNSNSLRKGELERDDEIIDDWDVSRKINDAADKARQDEVEKLKAQITNLNKQLASRTNENDDLYSELEMIKGPLSSTSSCGDISSRFLNGEFSEQYEESLGHLRDKVAELTLQLREKSMEVDQLVVELDRNTLAHSTSVQDFEDDMDRMECQFQEEIALLRDQLDELQNENEQLTYELDALDRVCQENDMRYEESKAQMENQQREILELSQSVEKCQTELENKSKELINLTESLKKSKNQLTSMEQALNEKGMEITELQCQLEIKIKRLESDEKLHESVVSDLKEEVRDKNSTIDELRAQVAYLENNLTQEKKSTYSNETQYRDQIIERNTLLMTTYQYLDDILSDGTNKQSTYPKPSANFKIFHEHLLSKLKALSNTYNMFDRRVKEIDNRWQEQYESLKNQMDIKLRLLNRFEGMINKATTAQKDWKEQTKKNQSELDAAKNTNDELVYQLSTLREQLEDYKVVSTHAEELEIKLRTTESRVKELEYREKQAEERLKVEKQGAKEKAESLIENIKDIEAQLQAQNRRNAQLQEMISMQKASMEEATNESKVRAAKVENTFAMLNEQLREQLEEKNKTIENERQRVKNLEDQFSCMLEEQKRLHLQIEGRETMISKVLSGLQMINQRKDVIENAALKNITEDMQIALSLDRKPSYQPPAYINPPWKPAGNNLSVAHPKKTAVKTPSTKSSIPVSSKSKGVNSTKSLIPTPSERATNEKPFFNKS